MRTHVRNYQRGSSPSSSPCNACAAVRSPSPAPLGWLPCSFHEGTGLPERETTPQRVAQRVPGCAEAEARHERRWRRAAAARENDDDADDDGPPALLVVAHPRLATAAIIAIDAEPSTGTMGPRMLALTGQPPTPCGPPVAARFPKRAPGPGKAVPWESLRFRVSARPSALSSCAASASQMPPSCFSRRRARPAPARPSSGAARARRAPTGAARSSRKTRRPSGA